MCWHAIYKLIVGFGINMYPVFEYLNELKLKEVGFSVFGLYMVAL